MVGWRQWALWAVALLGVGCLGEDTRARPEVRQVEAARPLARERVRVEAPPAPRVAVRFVNATVAERLPRERLRRGDPSWRKGRAASAGELQVSASAQSAQAGERISVEVSAREAAAVQAEVFRLGVYGGAGALKVWSGGPYTVSTLPRCAHASGSPRASCPEPRTFSFEIASDWEPGLYLVKVSRPDGLKSTTSLVVKERRAAEPQS